MMETLVNILLFITYLFFIYVGNFVCRIVFAMAGFKKTIVSADEIRTGRVIGILERVLYSLGIFLHNWETLVGVITFKSVARYKELDQKIDSEYFLVGSLVSLLWTILGCSIIIWAEEYLFYERVISTRFFYEFYRIYQ